MARRMLPCLGYREDYGSDGYEYDCEYEHSGDISCEDCIINGGNMSPQTGKLFRGNLKNYQEAALQRHETKNNLKQRIGDQNYE